MVVIWSKEKQKKKKKTGLHMVRSTNVFWYFHCSMVEFLDAEAMGSEQKHDPNFTRILC